MIINSRWLTEISEGECDGQTVSVKVVLAEAVQKLDMVQRGVPYPVVTGAGWLVDLDVADTESNVIRQGVQFQHVSCAENEVGHGDVLRHL